MSKRISNTRSDRYSVQLIFIQHARYICVERIFTGPDLLDRKGTVSSGFCPEDIIFALSLPVRVDGAVGRLGKNYQRPGWTAPVGYMQPTCNRTTTCGKRVMGVLHPAIGPVVLFHLELFFGICPCCVRIGIFIQVQKHRPRNLDPIPVTRFNISRPRTIMPRYHVCQYYRRSLGLMRTYMLLGRPPVMVFQARPDHPCPFPAPSPAVNPRIF